MCICVCLVFGVRIHTVKLVCVFCAVVCSCNPLQTEIPFIIKKNQIEKRIFGSRPDEITFFKQAAV